MKSSPTDWLIPAQVTAHQMNKWQMHARERLDLAVPYLQHRNVAIQAGGNLGIWPYLLIVEYGFRQVHTFEPDPDNLQCLLANTDGVDGAICHGAALGKHEGSVGWLKDRKSRPGWHKVAPHGGSKLNVDMMIIDQVPILADYDKIDLIALDVEGYELPALMGAERTLFRDKPVLILEDLHRSRFKSFRRLGGIAYGHPPGALQEWLSQRGYHKANEVKNDEVWVHS